MGPTSYGSNITSVDQESPTGCGVLISDQIMQWVPLLTSTKLLFFPDSRLRLLARWFGGPYKVHSAWVHYTEGRPWPLYRIPGPDSSSSGPWGPTIPNSSYSVDVQTLSSWKSNSDTHNILRFKRKHHQFINYYDKQGFTWLRWLNYHLVIIPEHNWLCTTVKAQQQASD